MRRLFTLLIAIALGGGMAHAAPPGVINSYVGVCDPNFPKNCAAPNSSGALPVTGSFSSSIAAFAPTGQAALAVSNVSARVALGSVGPTALIVNTGTVTAYVNFGNSSVSATTSNYPIAAGWGIAFDVGSNTYVAAITASGNTNLTVTTGTGLPAITGGGGSGGGPAATVAIDQSTPGTTNGVQVNAALPAGTNVIGHVVVDSGSVAVTQATAASLNATVVGAGTAGSPSGGVVSVQGVGSGTALPVSAASLPLPSGAATSALQTTGNSTLTTINTTLGSPFQAGGSIGNTSFAVTQGTATNLKAQVVGPGTAGSQSGGVLTVQGDPSGTAIPVTVGSVPSNQSVNVAQIGGTSTATGNGTTTAGTQRVTLSSDSTGQVTANAGTNLNTSLLALESGGNLANIYATLGTVTASPTANTVQDRLKSINTSVGTVNTTLGSPMQNSGGSVTANLGTLNGAATAANQTATQGAINGGSAATASDLVGGIYHTSAPTLTNGQQSGLQMDSSGNVKVNVVAGGGSGGTSSSFGAAFPGTGTAVGFSDGANMVAGVMNADNGLQVHVTNGSSGGTSSTDESAFTAGLTSFTPSGGFFQTTATSNALTNGQHGEVQMTANRALFANLRNAAGTEIGTASTPVQVSVANTGANATAIKVDGSAVTQPVSGIVTANAGTNLNTSALQLDTTGAALNLAQGSTTSGQTGPLVQTATTTAAPTYTTGKTNPLSTTTAGALRVDASGSTQPVSGTVAVTQSTSPWIVAGGGTAGSAASGVVSVQGIASMTPVQVSQATASNLNATVVGTGTFAVQAAQSGNWTSRIVGNAGATLDATLAAGSAPTNGVATIGVYNTSAPAPTNGQTVATQLDQAGNLRAFPGTAYATLSTWNSGTSINTTQNLYTNSGANGVAFEASTNGGTFSAGAITFEVTYDGTNWVTISADAVIDPTSTTNVTIAVPYTLVASTNKQFVLLPKGAQGIRVKLSTAITGTGVLTPYYTLLPYGPIQQISLPGNQAVNVAQFGGSNVVTGTGASGSGIPRVTISNDSSLAANQSVNVNQIGGSNISTAASGTQKVGIVGNAGATLDSTVGAGTAPTNQQVVGALYNSTEISPTTGQAFALQADSKGRLRNVIMDAAGNTRGANVNASNQLSVSLDGATATNLSSNVAQIGGTTVLTGNGTAGAGAQRITIASDNSAVAGMGVAATGGAVPANAVYNGLRTSSGLTGAIGCDSTATYDASTSGSTQLVALQSSQIIYVCGYTILAAGTVNVNLRYGTGSNCATSPSNITPAYQLTAQTGAVDGAAFYRGLKTIASNALCINTSGAVAVQAIVYYTQF